MGWTLVGPLGKQSDSYEIKIGLIGDANSIEKAKDFLEKLNVATYGKDRSFLHIDFPGLDRLRIRLTVQWEAEIKFELSEGTIRENGFSLRKSRDRCFHD